MSECHGLDVIPQLPLKCFASRPLCDVLLRHRTPSRANFRSLSPRIHSYPVSSHICRKEDAGPRQPEGIKNAGGFEQCVLSKGSERWSNDTTSYWNIALFMENVFAGFSTNSVVVIADRQGMEPTFLYYGDKTFRQVSLHLSGTWHVDSYPMQSYWQSL